MNPLFVFYFKMNKYYEDILNIFLGEEDEKK